MATFLGKVFSQNQSAAFVKGAQGVVDSAAKLSDELEGFSQEQIQARLAAVKERTGGYPQKDADIAEVFALVREASRRVLKERHYDVQLIGGLALSKGKIAEMRTGEGKTLVATLAATLRALAGKGMHLVTVNDYLARRDAAWMGQVYHFLGLSVGVVSSSGSYVYDPSHVTQSEDDARDETGSFRVFYDFLRPASKAEAYAADITYATNNELGFDYLRDNTAYDASQIVQRGHHYAIVDEIDSILIDEARTPLIISGPAADAEQLYERFATIARSFNLEEDYTVDEKERAIQLSDAGITKAEKALNIENLYTEGGVKFAHHLETAVRAKALFHKDKEYVVKDGEVVIVDEFTGRLQPGRRWSEGLHQAIEAKEGLMVQKETRTYASVTFQNYFRMYEALAGMTGTGLSSEEEFYTVYKLDVVVVPTNRTVKRIDHDDLIFQTNAGKYTALAREVNLLQKKGQPVLIGTVSIEDNELVSQYLTDAKIPHEVLNAKNHEREGELIAQAGRKGRVTVATNLAGRGVDIKLGGAPVDPVEQEEVRQIGGLAVIGTERHEARRIDNQLRGRSGRQGDPGETRFYVSLEDKLMRVFASDMLKKVMGTFKIAEDEPIASGLISKSLETAQKRIEGFNFDARKQVLAYDDVMNTQRLSIYDRRRTALQGTPEEIETLVQDMISGDETAVAAYEAKREELGAETWALLLRRLILQVTDAFWLEQLETMDYLRRTVSLRAYGQRDPLIEYRREGLQRFQQMEAGIIQQITEAIPRIMPSDDARIRAQEEKTRRQLVAASEGGDGTAAEKTPVVNQQTIGRNDTVTIRNGDKTQTLKYKKAEPLLAEGWVLET
ncbi:MAG: preprotein translocase subunit SecA [Parcubacteria bacterium C7867-007]|nr:MAG: preprotein translocase subunit SecA [Parcubacteria bacterium C7867-007]